MLAELYQGTASAQLRKKWQMWSLGQSHKPSLRRMTLFFRQLGSIVFQAQSEGDTSKLGFFKKVILEREFSGKSEEMKRWTKINNNYEVKSDSFFGEFLGGEKEVSKKNLICWSLRDGGTR